MTYKESLNVFISNLEKVFDNSNYTEAQAIAKASTHPKNVFFTNDTHCIVKGGQVYGRGQQITGAFTIAPAGAIPGDPDFCDTTRIYLQPQSPGPDFDLWYYDTVGQQWVNFGTFDAGVATSASDISYDLTSTPDLGTGDVQSAIEAVDNKVWYKQDALEAGDGIDIYKKVPEGYTEVEWLGSDSSRIIDTGISGDNNNLEIEMEYMYSTYVANAFLYGNLYGDSAHNLWLAQLSGSDSEKVSFYNNSWNGTVGGRGYSQVYGHTANTWHTLISSRERLLFDGGVSGYSIGLHQAEANDKNIVLFASNVNATVYRNIGLKVKRFIIRDSGTEVVHLVPYVRDSDGVAGMYDLVSKTFFVGIDLGTGGTGEFTHGDKVPTRAIIKTPLKSAVDDISMRVFGVDTDGEKEYEWITPLTGVSYFIQKNGGINSAGVITSTDSNYRSRIYDLTGVKRVRMHGLSCWQYTASRGWAVYDIFPEAQLRASTWSALTNHCITELSDPSTGTFDNRGWTTFEGEFDVTDEAKCLVVQWLNANHSPYSVTIPTVEFLVEKRETRIADCGGRLITEWTDGSCVSSIAPGSNMHNLASPFFTPDTAYYGARTAAVKVKKGDRLVVDLCSYYATYCIWFTDEELTCVYAPDATERFVKGVYTAPCDGYCYMRDILYKDCYIFSGVQSHLAYMLGERIERSIEGPVNMIAPHIIDDILPHHVSLTLSGAYKLAWTVPYKFYAVGGKFVLCAMFIRNSELNEISSSWYIYLDNADSLFTGTKVVTSNGVWVFRGYVINVGYTVTTPLLYVNADTGLADVYVDRIYVHVADTYKEIRDLYLDYFSPRYTDINLYDEIQQKEIDLWGQSMALQSISDLGYNIFDYGAKMPVDIDGWKYGADLLKSTPAITGSGSSKFSGNTDLVYFPALDFSGVTSTCTQMFENCWQLEIVGDIVLPSVMSCSYMFRYCYNLVEVGDIVNSSYLQNAFTNCYALRKIGKIDAGTSAGQYVFQGCTQLRRVEEYDCSNININLKKGSNGTLYTMFGVGGTLPNLRYFVMRGFGNVHCSVDTYFFSQLNNWGVNNIVDEYTKDARDSVIKTLVELSFDRVQANEDAKQAAIDAGTYDEETWTDPYGVITISLAANTKALLTEEEIEQITAKGYTIA